MNTAGSKILAWLKPNHMMETAAMAAVALLSYPFVTAYVSHVLGWMVE